MKDRLTPISTPIYAVRWIPKCRQLTKTKYYRHKKRATNFYNKLIEYGTDPSDIAIYTTNTNWTEQ